MLLMGEGGLCCVVCGMDLAEVEVHRLRVPDVQIAVGLRREPRDDLATDRPDVLREALRRVGGVVVLGLDVIAERLGLHVLAAQIVRNSGSIASHLTSC